MRRRAADEAADCRKAELRAQLIRPLLLSRCWQLSDQVLASGDEIRLCIELPACQEVAAQVHAEFILDSLSVRLADGASALQPPLSLQCRHQAGKTPHTGVGDQGGALDA
eukprot:CAMPEP_0181448386 /NCGR_PEP_ID=MMETSP1110-20121109/27114_1 /TAXON_ID=174948 /ORGANISM="Symbiodinium sp., Strain CCMP421" /LENGTH=109 /DNA_ID=CAMNT_0023572535 /DNA_START=100 /DNA_END=429 /DNA_ORIENTATION=+